MASTKKQEKTAHGEENSSNDQGLREKVREEASFVIANEFAYVKVTKVNTRNGMRLQIESPRLGFKVLLDPLELESLTWQRKDTFSKFLETPFGR